MLAHRLPRWSNIETAFVNLSCLLGGFIAPPPPTTTNHRVSAPVWLLVCEEVVPGVKKSVKWRHVTWSMYGPEGHMTCHMMRVVHVINENSHQSLQLKSTQITMTELLSESGQAIQPESFL